MYQVTYINPSREMYNNLGCIRERTCTMQQNPNNLYSFPPTEPAPQPNYGYHPRTASEESKLRAETLKNLGWAVAVITLGCIFKWMPMKFMSASLVMNLVITGASWMRRSHMTAKVVTDLHKGLVIITLLTTLGEWLFTGTVAAFATTTAWTWWF